MMARRAEKGLAMKFAVLVGGAAMLGAIATAAVPSSMIASGEIEVQALGDRLGEVKLADLNPVRAIYDWEVKEVSTPRTPEELGFHSSTVTAEPYSFASPGYDPHQFGGMNQRGGFGQPPATLPPDGPH